MPGSDTEIIQPLRPYDVLCGRGKTSYNNVGNRRFRLTISMNLDAYLLCKSKYERTGLVATIFDYLVSAVGARFLKPQKGGGYHELGETQAREKIAHALRDMAVCKNQTTVKEWTKQKRRVDHGSRRQKHVLESMMSIPFEDDGCACSETSDSALSSYSPHAAPSPKKLEQIDPYHYSLETLPDLDSLSKSNWTLFSEQPLLGLDYLVQ